VASTGLGGAERRGCRCGIEPSKMQVPASASAMGVRENEICTLEGDEGPGHWDPVELCTQATRVPDEWSSIRLLTPP
jgi:hypothetical protein